MSKIKKEITLISLYQNSSCRKIHLSFKVLPQQ